MGELPRPPGNPEAMDDIAAKSAGSSARISASIALRSCRAPHLVDDLGADSLDTVELVIAFETAFGIMVPEADVEHIHTVQDAIDYVQARRA